MSLFSDEHIEKIKNYDFFGTSMPEIFDAKSVIALGGFKEKIPSVSILLTTYKRPDMLRIALDSAINQKDFHDFEILVFDNECAPLDEITDTQRVIEEFNNDKVIYYRNQVPCPARMNMIPTFARTKWFCYLHDDDKLHPYHLSVMTKIVETHPEIDFLSCRNKPHNLEEFELAGNTSSEIEGEFVCRKVHLEETVFLDNYTWLGALIKTEKFFEIGGIPDIQLNMGDGAFVSKATYHLNRYYIHFPGYCYLHHQDQASSDRNSWYNAFFSNYFFACYVLRHIYGKCTESMEEMVKQRMINDLEVVDKERKLGFSLEKYFKKMSVSYDINDKDRVEKNQNRVKGWGEYLLKLRDVGDQFNVKIKMEKNLEIEIGK